MKPLESLKEDAGEVAGMSVFMLLKCHVFIPARGCAARCRMSFSLSRVPDGDASENAMPVGHVGPLMLLDASIRAHHSALCKVLVSRTIRVVESSPRSTFLLLEMPEHLIITRCSALRSLSESEAKGEPSIVYRNASSPIAEYTDLSANRPLLTEICAAAGHLSPHELPEDLKKPTSVTIVG